MMDSSQLEFPIEAESKTEHYPRNNSNTNNPPWSYSKRSTFFQCPRRYYYEYYGSNLRVAKNDPQKEKMRFLKKLSNRHMRVGQIMHLILAVYLRKKITGENWTIDRLTSWAHQIFNKDITYSKNLTNNSENVDKIQEEYPPTLLTEFYYATPDAPDLCDDSESRMFKALKNFMITPEYEAIFNHLIESDPLIEHRIKFAINNNIRVEGRIDLAFQTLNSTEVVDWKLSGTADGNNNLQLISYALWANHFFGVKASDIQINTAFLESAQLSTEKLTEDMISQGQARIRQDNELMKYLDPYGRDGIYKAFTPCEQAAICTLCSYQEVCILESATNVGNEYSNNSAWE